MKTRTRLPLFFAALICAGAPRAADKPVSFREQVAPILLEKCLTCHGPAQAKGGVRVDEFDFLMRKKDDGVPMVVPGNPDKSDLWKLLVTSDDDERMPQKSNPLPKETTEIVRRWIAEGAQYDGGERNAPLAEIVPPRAHPKAPDAYALPIPVTALAFSPDGTEIVAGGYRELTVWNATNGALLRRVSNVAPRTYALTFSPDGKVLAAAGGAPGEYGEVRLFDLNTGEMKRQFAGSVDAIMDVKFSPDGKLLAAAGADHHIALFDLEKSVFLRRFPGHSDAVTSIAFSPDGKQLASVGLDRSAKVFDVATGKLASTYREHTGPLYVVAFTPNGKEILSGGREKQLHQWTIADAKKVRTLDKPDTLKIALAGERVFLGGAGKKLRQFDFAGNESKTAFPEQGDWIYALAIHAASNRAAIGCYDGSVSVCDLADGKTLLTFIASPGYKPMDTGTAKTASQH